MKPKMMEIVQTSADALPTVAAIPPIENSTSAGTPLATQNAPVQSIFRCRPSSAASAVFIPFATAAVLMARSPFVIATHNSPERLCVRCRAAGVRRLSASQARNAPRRVSHGRVLQSKRIRGRTQEFLRGKHFSHKHRANARKMYAQSGLFHLLGVIGDIMSWP